MLFSDVWSENAALVERMMEFHSNLPKLYYGFNPILTGGGGGGQLTPPVQNPQLPRNTPVHEFFLSSLAHLLIPSL